MADDTVREAKINEHEMQLSDAVRKIFSTPEGKVFLQMLMEEANYTSIDRKPRAYEEECYLKGQREIINRIFLYMNKEYVIDLLKEKLENERRAQYGGGWQ